MRCLRTKTVNELCLLPLRIFLIPLPYSDFSHLGAVSYHNPRPGGTLGHTWRPLGPANGEATNRCLSFTACAQTEGGHFVPLWARCLQVEVEPKPTITAISSQNWFELQRNKQHSVTSGISINRLKETLKWCWEQYQRFLLCWYDLYIYHCS